MDEHHDPPSDVFRVDPGVWQMLQQDWGYPTIVGAHDELARWHAGLDDLAERLAATVPFVDRDAKGYHGPTIADHGVYTGQLVSLVARAASLIDEAYRLSLQRFST